MRATQTPAQKAAALDEAREIIADRAKDDPEIPDFRAVRPCNRCGHKRTVKVHVHRTAVYLDGVLDRHGQRRPIFKNDGESYPSHCTACAFDASAAKYESLARVNRERARKAREKQKRK